MPWCPNCKTEYRFGISQCSDCKAMLVEELSMEEEKKLLVSYEKEKMAIAEKLLEFLESESITCNAMTEEDGLYSIMVPESQLKRAEKILTVFTKIEAENEFSALDETEKIKKVEESLAKSERERNIHVYTKASDRYKENVSTAWTFLITGILGLIFTIANILGYLSIMGGELQYIVSIILFLAFIGLGIFSFTKNKSLQELAKQEEDNEKVYKKWLCELSKEELHSVWNKQASNEENEIVLVNFISEKLVKNFPELNENFADSLADEFFNEIRDYFIQ